LIETVIAGLARLLEPPTALTAMVYDVLLASPERVQP
jgi:hypothetical protein